MSHDLLVQMAYCQRLIIVKMPGPLPVLFGATAGTAPHAPILTIHGRDNYTFYSTGETYKIKSHITCNIFNVIYMIQCHLCIKFAIFWGNQTPPQGPFLDIDALYFTPPVVTSKPQFQNTFSAIATLFPICFLSLVLKHLDMNAIVLGKQVRHTSFIKPKPSSLWESINVTNYNHYVIFIYFS